MLRLGIDEIIFSTIRSRTQEDKQKIGTIIALVQMDSSVALLEFEIGETIRRL